MQTYICWRLARLQVEESQIMEGQTNIEGDAGSSHPTDELADGLKCEGDYEGFDEVDIYQENEFEPSGVRSKKLTSEAWCYFDIVKANGVQMAKCRNCKKILSYRGNGGTSHLLKHAKKTCASRQLDLDTCFRSNTMSALKTTTNLRPHKISGFDRTPLWNHVQVISTAAGNGGGGNRVWICNYCKKKVTGSYSKVKGHLLKISVYGVTPCKVISDEDYRKVKKEYEEAEANKAKEACDCQRKKDYFTSRSEGSDLMQYRRRGTEGSDMGELGQYPNIEENILALPTNERSIIDLAHGTKYPAVEETSLVEYPPKKRKVVREVTPDNNVPLRSSVSKIDFLCGEGYLEIETVGNTGENIDERGEQEETIIEMCANVNKTGSGTPASRAPTAAELLERRIFKKTTGGNKPFISGKNKFHIEVNPNFCDFEEGTSSIKPDLNQFYFPAAKDYLSKLRAVDVLAESAAYNIQSLQGILAVKERLEELEAKLDATKVSERFYREKSQADAKTICLLRKQIKELEAYGKKKKDEVLDCAGYYTFKTKAELMKDFLDGNTSKWKPEEDIKIWEENFAGMTPPGAEDKFDLHGEDASQ